MSDMFSLLSVQYTALFSIINPLGSAFVFFAITRALPLPDRERLAGRVGLYTWVTLLVALFGGLYLLHFFGISLPVLRVAGGIIVALTAWQVLTTSEDPMQSSLPHLAEGRNAAQLAVYPLTMPLTIGPTLSPCQLAELRRQGALPPVLPRRCAPGQSPTHSQGV